VTDLLDTSTLVRYLTLDPPDLGALAQQLIDSGEKLTIPCVALAETAFVLTRLYGIDRAAAVDLLVELLGRSNLTVLELPSPLAIEALLLCRPSGRVSFADALIWAAARNTGTGRVHTFDARFPAIGITLQVLGGRPAK